MDAKNGEQKKVGIILWLYLNNYRTDYYDVTITESGKNWVFLGIGVRIYKIKLRFYKKKFKVACTLS